MQSLSVIVPHTKLREYSSLGYPTSVSDSTHFKTVYGSIYSKVPLVGDNGLG